MKKIVILLLLAGVLLLTGCSSFLHREYSVVEPHSSTYYENEDVLRAENYQDIVNDLLMLVGQQAKEGAIWLYLDDGADAAELAERACREVQTETPLGAYAVPREFIPFGITIQKFQLRYLTCGSRSLIL